jgi:hypothetical protein
MAQYQGLGVSGNRSAFMQSFGNAVSEDDTTPAIGALLALADTIDMIRIAGGTRLQVLESFSSDLCTTGSLAVKVGYRKCDPGGTLTDDDDYFGSGLTHFQAAVTAGSPTRYTFAPITFNEDVFITATVTTAATGTAITTGTITTLARGKAVGIK